MCVNIVYIYIYMFIYLPMHMHEICIGHILQLGHLPGKMLGEDLMKNQVNGTHIYIYLDNLKRPQPRSPQMVVSKGIPPNMALNQAKDL